MAAHARACAEQQRCPIEKSKLEIAAERAQTDASLDAERAVSDADPSMSPEDARRLLDDLIERDRTVADHSLMKFRDGADRTLSRERSNFPASSSSVSHERSSADQRKQVERDVTDALLLRERERSDTAVETDRSEHDALRAGLEARRQSTDDRLSIERRGADTTATALGEIKSALAEAHTKHGRQHDVLGTVAHDLRSPLSAISLGAATIAETTAEASTRTGVQAIELAAARMDRLLSDLLDVARIASGTLRIVKRPHDVGALLLEVRRLYEPMFATRFITFTVDTPADGMNTPFDHDRIVQVLSNLLGNAMKFTQVGGAVALRVERQEDGIVFIVQDNGPGIPPSALSHIFERFWQIDSHTRRGLGLGLHICENIIQAHGGRIWAESEPDKGTTLRFTLPIN